VGHSPAKVHKTAARASECLGDAGAAIGKGGEPEDRVIPEGGLGAPFLEKHAQCAYQSRVRGQGTLGRRGRKKVGFEQNVLGRVEKGIDAPEQIKTLEKALAEDLGLVAFASHYGYAEVPGRWRAPPSWG